MKKVMVVPIARIGAFGAVSDRFGKYTGKHNILSDLE